MKLKYIFFDIDNTLFNSQELALRCRKNAMKAMIDAGLKADRDEAYEKLRSIVKKRGANYDRHFNELLEFYKADKPEIIAAGVVAYHDTKRAYLKPFPDVVPTMLKLSELGYDLGVITNGLAFKQWEKLIRLGLNHFFKVVVISEEVGFEKPSKEIFEKALEAGKCKAEEAVMVGDKESDINPARELGMKTISMSDVKADNNVKKFEEILDVIKNG
jgi:putative hydrolase of the HAD superfamily